MIHLRSEDDSRDSLTLRGTIKAMASMPEAATLYARAISHSETLSARRGRKHIPRWGSEDLYSDREKSVSFSHSKYRMFPSLR